MIISNFSFRTIQKLGWLGALVVLLLLPFTGIGQTYNVTTLAGSGFALLTNGTGVNASFNRPQGIAIDATGNVYVADRSNHCIRKITPDGVVTTFAGSGAAGFANGTGTAASFHNPTGVAVDNSGNVYVADLENHRIRKITPLGVVTTYAGSNIAGFVNSTGSSARFNNPAGVAVDNSGNVYVADFGNHSIRKISTTQNVTTLAGSGAAGFANGVSTSAQFNSPSNLVVDANGNVYVADEANHRIRSISAAGAVSTFAGSGVNGSANGTGSFAQFSSPSGIAIDADGNLYVAEFNGHRIRKITSTAVVTTLAGTGTAGFLNGTNAIAQFENPVGVALDVNGNIFIADRANHRIRKISLASTTNTIISIAAAKQRTFGDTVTVRGVVSMGTVGGNTRFMYDTSGGIGLFTPAGTNFNYNVGDSVEVRGTVSSFECLMQINVVSHRILATNVPVRILNYTANNMAQAFAENNIGKIVRITGLTQITNSTGTQITFFPIVGGSGANYRLNGELNRDFRVLTASNIPNTSIPVGSFSITGVMSRFINVTPNADRTGCTAGLGYQLVGRDLNDVGDGCGDNPAPNVTVSGATSFCSGGSVTLTAPAGFSYIWSNGATSRAITVNTSGSYTVSTIIDGCTSASSSPTVVTVNSIPSTPTITANGSIDICSGSSVVLSAPAGFSYLWSTGATTRTITVSTQGNYTVRTINNGCTSAVSASTFVTVNAAPTTPTITTSGSTNLCGGGSVTLSAPTGFSYLWSTGATTRTITVSTAGSYTVQTILNSCTSAVSAATVVTVNTAPSTPTIILGGPTTICSGSSLTLTAPLGFNYLWSTGATTRSIDVTTEGSYTVRTISGTCTSAVSAPVAVSVSPAPSTPTITANGPTSFCTGGSVIISGPTGFGYIWSNGATGSSITVNTSGTYTLRTILNSCTSEVSNTITVAVGTPPTTPTISTSGATTFCSGGSVTLSAPANFSYLWSNGSTDQSITAITSGSYTVRTISNGCISATSNAVVVTVNTAPSTPIITASGPTSFCTGGSVTLSAPAGFSYVWSNGFTEPSITVTNPGTYSVRTILNECTSDVSNTIVVTTGTPPPTPIITVGGPTTFCSGGSVTLNAPAGFTYLWNNNATSQSINATTAGSYSAQIILNGCTSNASAPIAVSVNPTPEIPIITASRTNLIGSDSSVITVTNIAPNTTYEWTTGQLGRRIVVRTGATVSARAILNDCPSDYSTPIIITGLHKHKSNTYFQTYPNPATDRVTIKTSGKGTLEVINMIGKVVIAEPATETNEINVGKLAKGVYSVRFNGASQMLVVK